MKKNLTVLVLLVAWTVLSISTLPTLAFAGEIPDVEGLGGNDGVGDSILDEVMLILMSLIKLAL